MAVSVRVPIAACPAGATAILPNPVSALFAVTQVPAAVPQTFCCLQVTEAEPLLFPTELERAPVPVRVLVVIEAAPVEAPANVPDPFS